MQWGAPPGSVVLSGHLHTISNQAAFQPCRNAAGACGGVLPRQALRCTGQRDNPSGRGSGLQNIRPDSQLVQTGQLICTSCRAGPSPSKHCACLGKDPGMLAGFDSLFNGHWGCCLPHAIYFCSGSRSLNRLSCFQSVCRGFLSSITGCSAAACAAYPSGVPELKRISQAPMGYQQVLSTHLHLCPAHLREALLKALGFSLGAVCFGPGTSTQWVQGCPSPAQANVGAFH